MPIPSESLATQKPVEDGKTSGGTDSDKERRKKNAAGGLNFVSAEFDNENWQKKAVRDPVERIKIKDSEGDPDQDTATETEKTVIKTVINTLESFEGNDEKPVEMFSHNRIRKRGKGRQKVEKMLPIVKQRNPEEATENTEDFVSDNPDRSAKAKTDPLPNPQRLEQPLPMTRTGFKPRWMSLGVLIIVIIIGSLLYIDLKNKTDEKIERLEKIVNVEIEKVRKETERGINENRKDGEWFNCKPKPGCSIARCDPRPASQWFGNDGLDNEYPILCQQNESPLPGTADTDIALLAKKDAEMRNEMNRVKKDAEEGKKKLNGTMEQITSLEKTNSELRNEMDSMKKEAEVDQGKFNGAMKHLEAKFNESVERLERMVVARLERGGTEIEETRELTAENSKRTEENKKRTYHWSSCDVVPRTEHESWEGKGGIMNVSRTGRFYEVYCDMTTDGGGWTVFQRRMDGSVDFYRTWEEYAEGFGNKSGEFWLGLEAVYQLTQDGAYELRVDLTDWDGSTRYANYGIFSISGRSDNYRLTFGEYSGTAGDSLAGNNNLHYNRPFSAKNKDLDASGSNCATTIGAAWWFGNCGYSSLNGRYNDTSHGHSGVYWYHWHNKQPYSLKGSEMKFRKK